MRYYGNIYVQMNLTYCKLGGSDGEICCSFIDNWLYWLQYVF